jgi:transcriptional regulator with XRE-family HTH domain
MARGCKPDAERRRTIAELRQQGLTLAEIGRRLGISRQCVCQTLHRTSRPRRPLGLSCSRCGRDIVSADALHRNREVALCLACLDQQPKAPFGQRLLALRLAMGLSLSDLARQAQMNRASLTCYEVHGVKPQPLTLARLVRVLGPDIVPPEQAGRQKRA